MPISSSAQSLKQLHNPTVPGGSGEVNPQDRVIFAPALAGIAGVFPVPGIPPVANHMLVTPDLQRGTER